MEDLEFEKNFMSLRGKAPNTYEVKENYNDEKAREEEMKTIREINWLFFIVLAAAVIKLIWF